MVVMDIFFEGWGDQKTPEWDDSIKPVNGVGRRRRVLSTKTNGKRSRKEEVEEVRHSPSGSDQIMTNTDISISPPTADFIPCFKDGISFDFFFSVLITSKSSQENSREFGGFISNWKRRSKTLKSSEYLLLWIKNERNSFCVVLTDQVK